MGSASYTKIGPTGAAQHYVNSRLLRRTPGDCIWCYAPVIDGREESGASFTDWMSDGGDFGCSYSPETSEDGTGGHARPSDPVIRNVYNMKNALEELSAAAAHILVLRWGGNEIPESAWADLHKNVSATRALLDRADDRLG